eukprot:TRINITY_DN23924_c0_g1_i2.p1 TRINITY_DN23924_c0_g1~~TRINITY_DN23924_c0_g1_i2.p1  ORF type:complete len:471 (+),score=68.58 TRINITY_DN23924_c0_g1_i2:165-1577(+)
MLRSLVGSEMCIRDRDAQLEHLETVQSKCTYSPATPAVGLLGGSGRDGGGGHDGSSSRLSPTKSSAGDSMTTSPEQTAASIPPSALMSKSTQMWIPSPTAVTDTNNMALSGSPSSSTGVGVSAVTPTGTSTRLPHAASMSIRPQASLIEHFASSSVDMGGANSSIMALVNRSASSANTASSILGPLYPLHHGGANSNAFSTHNAPLMMSTISEGVSARSARLMSMTTTPSTLFNLQKSFSSNNPLVNSGSAHSIGLQHATVAHLMMASTTAPQLPTMTSPHTGHQHSLMHSHQSPSNTFGGHSSSKEMLRSLVMSKSCQVRSRGATVVSPLPPQQQHLPRTSSMNEESFHVPNNLQASASSWLKQFEGTAHQEDIEQMRQTVATLRLQCGISGGGTGWDVHHHGSSSTKFPLSTSTSVNTAASEIEHRDIPVLCVDTTTQSTGMSRCSISEAAVLTLVEVESGNFVDDDP